VTARILAEGGTDLYLLLKDPDGDETLLDPLLDRVAPMVPGDWTIHRNGNNAALMPPFLGKAHAVRALLPRLRRLHPDAPVIGIGDSLSDAPYHGLVRLCDDAGGLAAEQSDAGGIMIAALEPDFAPFSGSYDPDDVQFLMKPVALAPTDVAAKERLIQSGARHYSEMIPQESVPGDAYLALYRDALARNGARLARDIVDLAGALAERRPRIVIASLARAGTPIGALLRRALRRLGVAAPHYSISIIRDRGIDREALRQIAARHDPGDLVFVDGWTGKGAIAPSELRASLLGSSPCLAVVADPAGQAGLAATSEDYLIPSGILGAIVSGLVSRSILNDALVGPGDLHACVHHVHLAPNDLSRAFVDAIDALAKAEQPRALTRSEAERREAARACEALMARLMRDHDVADLNRIKPGIAEATRAVLRRLPERLLVRDEDDPDVGHLLLLAGERGLDVGRLPADCRYRAVTIIREVF
jgi:hypothetical protein